MFDVRGHHRKPLGVGRLKESGDDALVEFADDLGVLRCGLAKGAEAGNDDPVLGVCFAFETDAHQYLGNRGDGRLEPSIFGKSDLGGKLSAVLPTNLLGNVGSVVGSYALHYAGEELRQQVVAARRELDRNLLGRRLIVFCRTSRTGPAALRSPTPCHLKVAIGYETIEMVSGYVGMNPK